MDIVQLECSWKFYYKLGILSEEQRDARRSYCQKYDDDGKIFL